MVGIDEHLVFINRRKSIVQFWIMMLCFDASRNFVDGVVHFLIALMGKAKKHEEG